MGMEGRVYKLIWYYMFERSYKLAISSVVSRRWCGVAAVVVVAECVVVCGGCGLWCTWVLVSRVYRFWEIVCVCVSSLSLTLSAFSDTLAATVTIFVGC